MRLVLLTILAFSIQVFANTGDSGSAMGEASLSSVMDTKWGKDSFVRDNTTHEDIKQLVDNLLNSPSESKIGEKSFPQADSSR